MHPDPTPNQISTVLRILALREHVGSSSKLQWTSNQAFKLWVCNY